MCLRFFPKFQRDKQPEHKESQGLKAPKAGGFRHGIFGEIFVFGCLLGPALMREIHKLSDSCYVTGGVQFT